MAQMANIIQYQPIQAQKHSTPMAKPRKITTCVNCRRTKRRCNRNRPSCSLCTHLGIKCHYPDPIPITKSAEDRQHQALNNVMVRLSSPSPNGLESLLLSAQKHQLQSVFWSVYLPKEECNSILGKMFGVASRFSVLQEAVAHADNLQSALQACVLTTLGRRCDNSQLLQQGMLFYSRCMRRLSKDLQVGEQGKLEDVLNTCQLLCLYEMMRPVVAEGASANQADAWLSHAKAACHLSYFLTKQDAGADDYLNAYERAHRLSFRIHFSSRRARCRTMYNIAPGGDVTRHTLYYITAKIPWLFMCSDKLLQELSSYPAIGSSDQFKTECIDILNAYFDLGHELCGWETKIIDIHNACVTSSSSNNVQKEHDLFVISRQHGIGFLLTICEYWTCRLSINFQTKCLIQLLQEKTNMSLPVLPEWIEPVWPFLHNIAESADTLLSTTAGLWVSEQSFFSITNAIHVAIALNARQSPEFIALQEAINRNQKGQIAFTRDFIASSSSESSSVDTQGDTNDPEQQYHHTGLVWFIGGCGQSESEPLFGSSSVRGTRRFN